MKMEHVTIDAVYKELLSIRKDLRELKDAFIPVEEISEEERAELHAALKEMESGKEKIWTPPRK